MRGENKEIWLLIQAAFLDLPGLPKVSTRISEQAPSDTGWGHPQGLATNAP
jgi:hypothetical protein